MAVYDDQIITLSQIQRIQDNVLARKNISPMLYRKNNYSNQDLINLTIRSFLIREKLSKIGYVISDDQVESQIKSTEERLKLTRESLLEFLEGNNLTFEEYFEITRNTIEFNIFISKVIYPLISITEQEVKNFFYKENISNKTLSFQYSLVDFYIDRKKVTKNMLNNFQTVLKQFQIDGTLPKDFADIETNILGEVNEDGLTALLKNVLKSTNEGSFSIPVLIGDDYHVFFVKKKDLTESHLFQKAKENIKLKLYESLSKKVTSLWLEREKNKHYIRYFFDKK